MSAILRLSLLTVTIICGATVAASSINQDAGGGGGGGGSGTAAIAIESGFRTVYNNYKQCEGDPNMLSCLKLKALKLVDRALAINNIPISEGISLAKREDHQRSLDEHWSTTNNAIDETAAAAAAVLPQETKEPNEKLDELLWKRVKQFVESRSLQLRVNKLLFGDDYDYDYDDKDNDNANLTHDASSTGTTTTAAAAARGKKDKNKGMYMYMMMMKGGMMALAYKGLALLAGKALLVSKIALTLALLVAIKKLFSGGHHSQKTTYEIVKTPIITHSHQYSGGNAAQNAHYANDFTGYEGGPYARSLDEAHSMASQHQHQHQYHYQQQQQPQSPHRITLKAVDANANADVAADATNVGADSDSDSDTDTDIDSRYTTSRIGATAAAAAAAAAAANSAQARSLSHSDDSFAISAQQARRFNVPYAHLAAYSRQLALARSSPRPYTNDNEDASSTITTATATATATTVKSVATAAIN